MEKIIFVPGINAQNWNSNIVDLFSIRLILNKYDVRYFMYDRKADESLMNVAKDLRKYINKIKLKKGEKIILIGHSAGGLIIDYYLKFLNNKKVSQFVSIATPFKGCLWLNYIHEDKKAIEEMAPGSSFLKKLTKKRIGNVKRLSIWCYADYVVPGKSCMDINSRMSIFPVHMIAHLWPPTVYEIKEFLEDN